MKPAPTIQELTDGDRYNLLAMVEQKKVKEFIVGQVMTDKKLIPIYMVYQTLLFLSGLFFLTRALVLAFRGSPAYLLVVLGTILFSFTLLVVIHELLHGLALLAIGAPRISFGGDLRRFVFYAAADRFVIGRQPFLFVALMPLAVVQLVAVAGIIVWFYHPFLYFFLILMTMHSFFCSGDIALVSVFYRHPGKRVYMYDVTSERVTYFFAER